MFPLFEASIAPVRGRRFRPSETDASDHASAARDRLAENVDVVAVAIAQLKLGYVQRQVLRLTL